MRDDFGVGLSNKLVVSLSQAFFQLQIVFNDAVVDHYNATGAVAMRMGVFFGGTAVGGPTRVANAISAVEWSQANRFFKIAQLAFSAPYLELRVLIDDGDARRIVPAILKLTEPVDNQRHNLLIADITNNSAHKSKG